MIIIINTTAITMIHYAVICFKDSINIGPIHILGTPKRGVVANFCDFSYCCVWRGGEGEPKKEFTIM